MNQTNKVYELEEVKAVPARYSPTGLDIFSNNPLIKALPNFENDTSASIAKLLSREPQAPAATASRTTKFNWLTALDEVFFVPLSKHIELQELIDSVIRVGYLNRNPTSLQEFEELRQAYERQQNGQAKICFPNQTAKRPITVSLLGWSGIGKSVAIDRILELYPQRIHHSESWVGFNLDQVVYLKVECPHEGSIKSLCQKIISELSRITSNPYSKSLSSRETLNSLEEKVVNLLSVHKVGLLVIDEIQNLLVSRKNREELFNFIVSIPNTLGVPILMVGTPKILKFMQTDLRIARRFGSKRCLIWKNMDYDSSDWKKLIGALWKYNLLDDASLDIPEPIEQAFYEYSQGIPAVLIELFVDCVAHAMVRQVALTPKLIKWCFNEDFKNVSPMIRALQKNDLEALQKYEDIKVGSTTNRQSIKRLREEIERTVTLDWQEQQRKANARMERMVSGQLVEFKQMLMDMLKKAKNEGIDVEKLIAEEMPDVQQSGGAQK